MTAAERGFLLLCCDMGQAQHPLTLRQLNHLRRRVSEFPPPTAPMQDVTPADLRLLGYSQDAAAHIVSLLNREEALDGYLSQAAQQEIFPLCCNSPGFPSALRSKLASACPPVLFYRGNPALLTGTAVALVGSRQLSMQGAAFARRVGELAAEEALTLVSGNATGADRIAQEACLQNGGKVVSILADALHTHRPENERIVYLCEGGWHLPFSAIRALSRNRLIHALAEKTFVAQSACGSGGTWSGTEENLRKNYSPVFVHDDGSVGMIALVHQGATPIATKNLHSLRELTPLQTSFL